MTNEPYYSEENVKPAGKGNGIASFVCGLISVVCCCSILCIPSLICGIYSIVQAKKAESKVSGLAIAGVILGAIALVIWIISLITNFSNPNYVAMLQGDTSAFEDYMNSLTNM